MIATIQKVTSVKSINKLLDEVVVDGHLFLTKTGVFKKDSLCVFIHVGWNLTIQPMEELHILCEKRDMYYYDGNEFLEWTVGDNVSMVLENE
jgi:hypothetical protein